MPTQTKLGGAALGPNKLGSLSGPGLEIRRLARSRRCTAICWCTLCKCQPSDTTECRAVADITTPCMHGMPTFTSMLNTHSKP